MNWKKIFAQPGRAFLLVTLLADPLVATSQTTAFNFSGRLSSIGLPVTGNYDLQFRVYGSAAGSDLISGPITHSPVGIKGGLFSSKLDFGDQVFNGSTRWLQVSVRPVGTATYTNLSPRIELTAAPYAIRARSAATADNFSSGSVVTALNSLTGNVTLSPGSNINIVPIGNTLTINSSGGGSGGGGSWSTLGTNTYYNTGNVGIGTTTPTSRLDVRGPLTLEMGGNAALFTGVGGGEMNRYLNLFNSAGYTSASGLKAGGLLVSDSYFYADPGKNELIVNGFVGIGTPSPIAPLHVDNDWVASGDANALLTGNQPTLEWQMSGLTGIQRSWMAHETDNHELEFSHRYRNVSVFPVEDTGWVNSLKLRADGGININGSRGIAMNAFDGPIISRGFDPFNGNAGNRAGHGRWGLFMEPSRLVCGIPDLGGRAFEVAKYNVNGTRTELLRVDQNGYTTVKAITITGGVDLAEPFQMSQKGISEGSVVVIDEQNPGKLKLGAHAYDKRVAGIVSGANGVNPGISLHQEGLIEGGQNVALSGRVYVHADAAYGAIKPGDLLTTSDTPGHAMRVSDHTQAQGAILGKAMTPLNEGKGMVLVLVTLQ